MTIDALVFSGGGVLGSAFTGGVTILYKTGLIEDVRKFGGTSAGAILAGILACRPSLEFLEETFDRLDFNSLRDPSSVRLFRLMKFFGYYSGKRLVEWYRGVIKQLTGDGQITLAGVYQRYGTELAIVATNVDKRRSVVLSHRTHPDLELVQAVRMSASYPFFFEPVKYDGDLWVDGGLLNNFPIRVFDSEAGQTLGFLLVSSSDLADIVSNVDQPTRNVFKFSLAIGEMLINSLLKTHVDSVDRPRVIMIDVGKLSSMNFNISTVDRAFLFEQGRVATEEYVRKIFSSTINNVRDETNPKSVDPSPH